MPRYRTTARAYKYLACGHFIRIQTVNPFFVKLCYRNQTTERVPAIPIACIQHADDKDTLEQNIVYVYYIYRISFLNFAFFFYILGMRSTPYIFCLRAYKNVSLCGPVCCLHAMVHNILLLHLFICILFVKSFIKHITLIIFIKYRMNCSYLVDD